MGQYNKADSILAGGFQIARPFQNDLKIESKKEIELSCRNNKHRRFGPRPHSESPVSTYSSFFALTDPLTMWVQLFLSKLIIFPSTVNDVSQSKPCFTWTQIILAQLHCVGVLPETKPLRPQKQNETTCTPVSLNSTLVSLISLRIAWIPLATGYSLYNARVSLLRFTLSNCKARAVMSGFACFRSFISVVLFRVLVHAVANISVREKLSK